MLQAGLVDAIVLHIYMVPMNGLVALKAIRAGPASTHVVMLTSLNDIAVFRACGELDCEGLFFKTRKQERIDFETGAL
jgi:DNA-binding NarL/FixJ family response regulator